ncbi:MAG: hypothetical protein H8E71_03360 [Candidatus Marinimicrobia bacterium]|nr:hypothetical protein [Candidatus Neomarinimicrobiota bacterium]MBL7109830.1 hypothetical protein [Candidatus Neomarinimicrobiota bacterium]
MRDRHSSSKEKKNKFDDSINSIIENLKMKKQILEDFLTESTDNINQEKVEKNPSENAKRTN